MVFEGVFERAFKIIHDEGAPDGGVVVQVRVSTATFETESTLREGSLRASSC